jgi:UDP-N-acetylglucosamine 2-epimerase (non-hydrolysing)/GDP/UDP-N,N'-diacetylbacillosamine 2-epimerase (hydrolysing)
LNKKKVCVVTGTRADYGLLYWLLNEIKQDDDLKLQLVVTGMHLSPEFGLTYKSIEEDGFKINDKIETLMSSDSEIAISKAVGLGCISFSESLKKLNPDMIVLLGDRFEILSSAISAMILKIPVVHLHGGETTQGLIDESIRHSITKIATYHFPATESYKKRIIQMGEKPDRVFNYGMAGLDNLYKLDLLSVKELENELNFKFDKKTAIVTYHPVTLESNTAEAQINSLLKAIDKTDIKVIFTKSNADTDGRIINKKIEKFVNKNPDKYIFIDNLGQLRYLSVLKYANLMIGNSSSGLTEAPSFKLPVVNIGDRQKGRVKAKNVIDCNYKTSEIVKSITKAISKEFNNSLKNMINPYDKYEDGKTSYRIKEKLKELNFENEIIKKDFYNINFNYEG